MRYRPAFAERRSLNLPSVPDLDLLVKTFVQRAEHIRQVEPVDSVPAAMGVSIIAHKGVATRIIVGSVGAKARTDMLSPAVVALISPIVTASRRAIITIVVVTRGIIGRAPRHGSACHKAEDAACQSRANGVTGGISG